MDTKEIQGNLAEIHDFLDTLHDGCQIGNESVDTVQRALREAIKELEGLPVVDLS